MRKACDRAVRFGARCPNDATAVNARCVEHQTGQAPRAPAPDVVLVKFTLPPNVLHYAAGIFRAVARVEELIESSHGMLAKVAGVQFKGKWRPDEDKPGDSGVPVLRRTEDGREKQGVKDVAVGPLRGELEGAGFVLEDVHVFEKPNATGVLVCAYRTGGAPFILREKQVQFLDQQWLRNWGYGVIWANIPTMAGKVGDVNIQYVVVEDRGENVLVGITKPLCEELLEVSKEEIGEGRLQTLHTVNVGGSSRDFKLVLTYEDGLWGVK